MIELLMIFVGGLLGSGHCVGMCGPIALTVAGPAPGLAHNLCRQLTYSAGRIFTYATLGALAGGVGMRLAEQTSALVNVQAALAIVAGVLLIWQGLISAGVIGRRASSLLPACLAPGLVGRYLREPRLQDAFLAGVFTGFLPCGLVYAYVALAASSGAPLAGMAEMVAFGMGTAPLLIGVGAGGSLLTATTRQRALRLAACFVIAMGGMSLVRGAGQIGAHGDTVAAGCPMCR